jgi:hypothetical protein
MLCAGEPSPHCGFECSGGYCSEPGFPHCDLKSHTCTECDPDPKSPDNRCPGNLVCHYSYGICVECASAYNCTDPSKPVCNFLTWECQACQSDDDDCGPGRVCDESSGRCQPQPTPNP